MSTIAASPNLTTSPDLTRFFTMSLSDRKRWTVDECEQLERQGLLPEKYELIDGEIIDKMGQYQPHAFCVLKFIIWLSTVANPDNILSQASANSARPDQKHNRPEPDVVVYRAPTYDLVEPDKPLPALTEAIFVVEVADTTLPNDLGVKAALYARANVPEYWVMNVRGRELFVHLLPVNGKYTDIRSYDENSLVAPGFAPNNAVRVGSLLSPLPKP